MHTTPSRENVRDRKKEVKIYWNTDGIIPKLSVTSDTPLNGPLRLGSQPNYTVAVLKMARTRESLMIETWHLQVLLILIMQVLSSHVLFVFIVVVLFVFVSLLFAVNADFDICSVKTVYCFNHCLMAFSFWMDNIKGVTRLFNVDQDMGFVWPFW